MEIAAIVGAYIRCAQVGLPVIVDGFISSVAALCAMRMNLQVRDWMLLVINRLNMDTVVFYKNSMLTQF